MSHPIIIPQPDIEQKPTTIVVDELTDQLSLDGVKVVISVSSPEDSDMSPAGAVTLAIQELIGDPALTRAEVQGIITAASGLISALPRS